METQYCQLQWASVKMDEWLYPFLVTQYHSKESFMQEDSGATWVQFLFSFILIPIIPVPFFVNNKSDFSFLNFTLFSSSSPLFIPTTPHHFFSCECRNGPWMWQLKTMTWIPTTIAIAGLFCKFKWFNVHTTVVKFKFTCRTGWWRLLWYHLTQGQFGWKCLALGDQISSCVC